VKAHRKQSVNVHGKKCLVDVPVDGELYRADNREEYQRVRSKNKHVSLDTDVIFGIVGDVADAYEQAQLFMCLRESLRTLSDEERQLIQYIYFDGYSEKDTATILMVARQTVNKKKLRILKKLRSNLAEWIE
jgi:RNA polymerase sigma factor (sigma-70 family)